MLVIEREHDLLGEREGGREGGREEGSEFTLVVLSTSIPLG